MRVRNGQLVRYTGASLYDRFRPCTGNNLQPGQIVRVCTLPSAPPPNTMGQCYVADPETGKFICMVSTGSLESVKPSKSAKSETAELARLRAKLAETEGKN